MTQTRVARCFCKAVEVEVTGDPVTQGFCHCTSCRRWTAQPVLAYALWPKSMVRTVKGADHLAAAPRNENLTVHFCKTCGGSIMAVAADASLTDVFPMLIEGFTFEPVCHVNYGERAIDMRDGLPKFRDMPARAGGSDELMPE
jgi:hypothetical protein